MPLGRAIGAVLPLSAPLKTLILIYETRGGSHHPQLEASMQRFVKNGNTCPAWEHEIVSPLIAALPFWFRLWQCARRYQDTRQRRHLLNMGKYASSLLVVVVSSPGWPLWAVIVASAFATAYAAAWDVCMDWGLGCRDLCSLTRAAGSRYGSPQSRNFSAPPSPTNSFEGSMHRGPASHYSRRTDLYE